MHKKSLLIFTAIIILSVLTGLTFAAAFATLRTYIHNGQYIKEIFLIAFLSLTILCRVYLFRKSLD
ncbi:MAG: hypothetical protein PHQ35_10780 [Phycisphaerae bacterium]|nr:hypothetical protein [Phycisphaerae bacterium]MDD5382016.1 hypothetical protein [Phycisphaerae bacterium]